WHVICLIQIGYIRYSSGTGLSTVNDIHVITFALQFQKKTNLRAFFPTESFHICLPAVLYSVFLCHCNGGKQSPISIRK
ncbi:mCG1043772, partial [Mus musculus]